MEDVEMDVASPEVMLTFYNRIYPFQSIFNWLNQGHTPTKRFTHREFAFTLQNDVYLRYNSFATYEDLKKQVCQYNPSRFEIGPVYSLRPRDRKTARPGAMVPLERELVFDIDMTDYDSIRTCCSGADICKRCWGFIAAAVHVIDDAIRKQFGYNHLLWVYSGRRGIHLWISDKEALELTDDQRKAIVGWLTVVRAEKSEMAKKTEIHTPLKELPPLLKTALEHLKYTFNDLILEDQDPFSSDEGFEHLLRLITDSGLAARLRDQRKAGSTSKELWLIILKATEGTRILQAMREDIIFHYTYPRLDAEVSKHRNHLLKAPFCVHPKTGRVCVPIDPIQVDDFDPAEVPTVNQLMKEINTANTSTESSSLPDWHKTALRPYIDMLDKHVQGIMDDAKRSKGTDLSW
ncbi:prim-pol domain-containing protein [Pluteus cervinus]|uniref:Prim-pol domain-containing protein n=1 Tax=Pluteus cervinus TaxID=181527 RepID=A0ACD3BC68_9AGAR|nr:prim-pol domain-containing protein [Pluteus cervinus]